MQYELVTSTVQSGESKVKQTLKINLYIRIHYDNSHNKNIK